MKSLQEDSLIISMSVFVVRWRHCFSLWVTTVMHIKKHRIECRETHVRLLFAWMLAEKLKHWSQFFWHYVYFCFFYSSTCMHNSCRSKQYTVLVFMPLGQLFKEWKSEMVFWWCYCTCVCTYRLGVVSSTDVKTGLYKEQTFPQIQYWSGWVSDSAFN